MNQTLLFQWNYHVKLQTRNIVEKVVYFWDVKSNQITFIVTSPQHKCLGEWNSYERAPDSAEKQQTIYLWTDSAKKTTNNLHMDRQCKKNNKQFTYGQTVQKKQQTIYIWTDSAKKQQTIYIWTDSAKNNNKQFTYGQTVQKKQQTIYIWTDSAKKLHWSIYSAPDSAKKTTTAIYIWTDSAKKQQQFTYGQYIFTDCTEDNVQNTHTYTQYA